MSALNSRLKVKQVLFFLALALTSAAIHLFILLAVDVNYAPFEKSRVDRQMMRVGFVGPKGQKKVRAPMPRATPKPSPAARKTPPAKKVAAASAETAPEEQVEKEEEEEVPETFSKFLEGLAGAGDSSDSLFRGDSYDVLGDGLPAGGLGESPSGDTLGMMREVLDPRVQMVINSYPPTSIERNYSYVRYPDITIERKDYEKGWTSVYFELITDSRGRIESIELLRPEKPGELEQVFVDAVLATIRSWKFDRRKAEIHVDVRFYVE